MTDQTPVLRLEGVVKTFPGVRALDGVSFDLRPGEVHALMGENGAGKSTLMKVLGGIYDPDEGRIYIAEEPVEITSPLQAKARGVVFIHQELSLADELTVAENIWLGELPRKSFGRVDFTALAASVPLRKDTRVVIDLAPIVEASALAMLIGLGVGLLVLTPAGLFPLFNVVWGVLTRPLMIMSGVIYIYEDLPTFAQNIIWYNPLVHLTGLMRTGFYPTYTPAYISIPYVVYFGIIALTLGLIFSSRYHRQIQAA
jgi:ABC-type sugar transport system ATPase subunit